MTLLLSADEWARRRMALNGSLGALADGIAGDLEPVLARPVDIPAEKALLSRAGGRCAKDGELLAFDPFDEHRHRCERCGAVHEGTHHRGFWRYWYHLWLAERAVHAAVLYRLRGDDRHATFAAAVLGGYADRYAGYPNADNVLGPARVFFSTYLESIWLLQLCIALDALEHADPPRHASLGERVREHIVEPASALIEQYDEGMSNRQVWNTAALIAAARVRGRHEEVQALVDAPHGLAYLLANGCLADGTWYEGENYHMFAHRGLWYAVTMAEMAGAPIPPHLVRRFDAGFAAPFLTALPDMTLPSRRDSQYAISLRQPRFAEPCEIGLARVDDPRLLGMLDSLYSAPSDVPVRDNGRRYTAADVERNLPPMRLNRADLGWRTLLFAREQLPAPEPQPLPSVLLDAQGIAVLRREGGRLYAALDYGHSGGGHGHPDRLNVLLMDGTFRWLDDMGTGSYVDPTLHWYRSTLAHNAPLVNGVSQRRVDGELLAFEDRGAAGWVHARVDQAADGVRMERILVAMPDYLIDELRWTADAEVAVDLPNHAPVAAAPTMAWMPGELRGGTGLEDGFDFASDSHVIRVPAGQAIPLLSEGGAPAMAAFVAADLPCELWRAVAPGAPGRGEHTFHVIRAKGRAGRIRTVWSWVGDVTVQLDAERIVIERGAAASDAHWQTADGWHIGLTAGTATSSIDLGGVVDLQPGTGVAAGKSSESASPASALPLPLNASLGERDYRRSEQSWREAGSPTAEVSVSALERRLQVRVHVMKEDPLVYTVSGDENLLDNEPAEINADGMQLYVLAGDRAGAWTIVPVPGTSSARARRVRGWDGLGVADTGWEQRADGYVLTATVELAPGVPSLIGLGLVVNETAPGRARRRGQLVLGGAAGEWVYLRGDRLDPARLLPIRTGPGDLMF